MNRRITNWRKGFTKGTALFLALNLTACGNTESAKPVASETYDPDLGFDPSALTPISGTCSFSVTGTTSGTMTIVLADSDVAFIAKADTGIVTINDQACAGGNAWGSAVPAGNTGVVVKKITIASGTSNMADEEVILDYTGGIFAPGGTATGIDVDLKGGTGDVLAFRGSSNSTTVDNVQVGPSGINYTASATADAIKDFSYANVEGLTFLMQDGNDIFTGAGATTPNLGTGPATVDIVVHGGPGNDSIHGGGGNDTLSGEAGNDVFTMAASPDGNDTFNGGADSDTVSYGGVPTFANPNTTNIPTGNGTSGMRTGNVTVTLDNTTASGERGMSEADILNTDIEFLMGGSGADTLIGAAGAQKIYGGAGNDILRGKAGDDSLYGEAGADTFDEESATTGNDILSGGADVDVADYHLRSAALTISVNDSAGDGDTGASESDNVMTDVESVLGGSTGDTLSGSLTATAGLTLFGNGGDDVITGGGSNDAITGGDGNDTLSGGAGDDVFLEGSAASGNDSFAGGAGRDTVDYSGRGASITAVIDNTTASGDLTASEADIIATDIEGLIGGTVGDTLTSALTSGNNDQLVGNSGGDTLSSGDGNDIIEGDSGTDVIDCGLGDGDICLDPADCGAATGCEL